MTTDDALQQSELLTLTDRLIADLDWVPAGRIIAAITACRTELVRLGVRDEGLLAATEACVRNRLESSAPASRPLGAGQPRTFGPRGDPAGWVYCPAMTSQSADVAALAAYVSDLRLTVSALEPFIVPGGLELTHAGWGDIRTAIQASHVSLDRNLPDVRAWLASMN